MPRSVSLGPRISAKICIPHSTSQCQDLSPSVHVPVQDMSPLVSRSVPRSVFFSARVSAKIGGCSPARVVMCSRGHGCVKPDLLCVTACPVLPAIRPTHRLAESIAHTSSPESFFCLGGSGTGGRGNNRPEGGHDTPLPSSSPSPDGLQADSNDALFCEPRLPARTRQGVDD